MANEYARMLAQGVINLNTDLHPVAENTRQEALGFDFISNGSSSDQNYGMN